MRLPRWLIIALVIASLFAISKNMVRDKNEASVFDIPKKLQAEKMKLTVWPYRVSNGAMIFSTSKIADADDRLYLEPATTYLDISVIDFKRLQDSGYSLHLYGSFFKGKGIPKRFFPIQPKPDLYSVFRYESMDLVKE